MTASELARYFSDRKFFTDPDQEVRFVLSPEDVPLEKGTWLEMRGSTVPERGEAVVAFRPVPKRKYKFSLKFEATPVIEAQTFEEAERMALEMMRGVRVTRQTVSGAFEDMPEYVPHERSLGEEKE